MTIPRMLFIVRWKFQCESTSKRILSMYSIAWIMPQVCSFRLFSDIETRSQISYLTFKGNRLTESIPFCGLYCRSSMLHLTENSFNNEYWLPIIPDESNRSIPYQTHSLTHCNAVLFSGMPMYGCGWVIWSVDQAMATKFKLNEHIYSN